MSDIFYAIDYHTHLCEHAVRDQTAQERLALAHSHIMYRRAKNKYDIDLNMTIATPTDTYAPELTEHEDVMRELTEYLASPEGTVETFRILKHFNEEEQDNLFNAETIFVSSEILQEVAEAAETMPDSVLIPQDLFVPNGVLVFETPYKLQLVVQSGLFVESWLIHSVNFRVDKENSSIEVRLYGQWRRTDALTVQQAVEWDETKNGFTLHNITDEEAMMKALADDNVERGLGYMRDRAASKYTLVDATRYDFNKEGFPVAELGALKKHLIALFRMTNSYLDVEKHRPPRHFTKRAKRAKRVIPDEFYLSVLTLRHRVSDSQGGTHSSPKFAFRVRGHWAKRYLRSLNKPVGDPEAYRYVYIKDYIKGKDKPLVESTRIIKISN